MGLGLQEILGQSGAQWCFRSSDSKEIALACFTYVEGSSQRSAVG
jgi:hypothetical protein